MFKSRKPNQSTATELARLSPGKLIFGADFIKIFLGDVNVMTTLYVKTRKLSQQDALVLAKQQVHIDRHHQLYV